jgi:hypothetical protein
MNVAIDKMGRHIEDCWQINQVHFRRPWAIKVVLGIHIRMHIGTYSEINILKSDIWPMFFMLPVLYHITGTYSRFQP